jgi:hypothetical protein
MPSDPFYRSTAWRRLRAARLRMDGHRCVVPGCGQPAKYVDHIVPRRDGGGDALSNLRSLCAYHDNAIRQDRHGKRRMGGKFYVRDCNADGSPRGIGRPSSIAARRLGHRRGEVTTSMRLGDASGAVVSRIIIPHMVWRNSHGRLTAQTFQSPPASCSRNANDGSSVGLIDPV